MKRRSRSDSALTFALCMSLIVHAAFWAWVLRDDITYLTRQLHQPALVDARDQAAGETSADESDPPTVIAEAPVPIEEFKPPQPPPPSAPPKPKKPNDVNEENIDWGEKNGKGFAVTSAPGKRPLQARQGIED